MNFATAIVALAVAAIFVAIVVNEIRKKKNGKSSCGGDCGACGRNCHK